MQAARSQKLNFQATKKLVPSVHNWTQDESKRCHDGKVDSFFKSIIRANNNQPKV
jgi:hypothetical protein